MFTLGAPIKASKPSILISPPVQDVLLKGDNTSAVNFTVRARPAPGRHLA